MTALVPRLLLGLALAGAALWLLVNRDRLDPAVLETAMRSLGTWAPLAYVALFALATLLFVPGVLFGLAGGALFGPVLGTLLNLAGATLGATAAFLVGRYLAGDRVRRRTGPRLERLIAGVEAEGWRFVALVRLVPLFPFNLTNYALGLTRIPLAHYVLAYTWLGHAGREAAAGDEAAIRSGLMALALLAAVAFLPKLVRRLRDEPAPRWIDVNQLAGRLIEPESAIVIDVRGPDEFRGPLGHIPEARNLPVDELANRLSEINALKDKPVMLVCRTDKRSAKAASVLQSAGFCDVRVLRGGMELWSRDGLPVESRTAPGQAP